MKFKDNFPELNPNQWAMLLRLLMEAKPELAEYREEEDDTDHYYKLGRNSGIEDFASNITLLLEGRDGGFDKTQ